MNESAPEPHVKDWLVSQNVSRETIEKLMWFAVETRRWTKKINLVAPGSVERVWERHILDSAQLILDLKPEVTRIVDLGSGGGFPVLPLAILDLDHANQREFISVEADKRKAAFQSHVVRHLGLNVRIEASRIEKLEPQGAQAVVSRALASLTDLIGLARRHVLPSGELVFLKGKNVDAEIEAALVKWSFSFQKRQSTTDPNAAVLKLTDIKSKQTE